MCIFCDSTNINTIIEFVPNVSGDGFNCSSGTHIHPVSWNCVYHLRMELLDGGCFPNLVRNCRWTFILRQSFWINLYLDKLNNTFLHKTVNQVKCCVQITFYIKMKQKIVPFQIILLRNYRAQRYVLRKSRFMLLNHDYIPALTLQRMNILHTQWRGRATGERQVLCPPCCS